MSHDARPARVALQIVETVERATCAGNEIVEPDVGSCPRASAGLVIWVERLLDLSVNAGFGPVITGVEICLANVRHLPETVLRRSCPLRQWRLSGRSRDGGVRKV